MKKIFLSIFLLAGLIFSQSVLGSTIAVSRPEGENFQPSFSLAEKIQEAQMILKRSRPLDYATTQTPIYNKLKKVIGQKVSLTRQEIALAVLDRQTRVIFEKRYWLDADEMKKADQITKYYLENTDNLPHFTSVDAQEDFTITVNWWNSHNSDLSISKNNSSLAADLADQSGPSANRYVILANKWLIDNANLAYAEDQNGADYSDIVYVPYSADLHQLEIIKDGQSFLENQVEASFAKLRQLQVPSKAFPGQLAAEAISPQFVKNLFLVEQTDPRMMLTSDDGGKRLVDRVFVRLGTNQEKAFRYTFSKTGALGLGQIMPGTYGSIVKGYPSAELIKDVDIGRVDIQNGIMASILTLDDHLATVFGKMTKTQRAKFDKKLKINPDFINEVRAAIYNGGPGKYLPATTSISLKRNETIGFLQKYKMIRSLKLFN